MVPYFSPGYNGGRPGKFPVWIDFAAREDYNRLRRGDFSVIPDRYDLSVYMAPYWEGTAVCHEAVLPLAREDGSVPDIPLLYPAETILSVRSADLRTEYRAGADYLLADGCLRIPAGSAIVVTPHGVYYPAERNECCKPLNEAYGEGFIFFSEGPLMHTMQLSVTYTHRGVFPGPVPADKGRLLPITREKLRRGDGLRLCIYGDSICVGGNSSGFVEAAPFAPTWWQMTADALKAAYPACPIDLQNPSVGGKRSDWGAEEAPSRVGYGPDLCVIGFGMNDGSRRVPPEEYGRNIRAIMAAARAGNPACEFVLLATTLPNPHVGKFLGFQADYLPVLQAMEGPGIAVADMTTFHRGLLSRKRFWDMSGNNVNHPNDFLARAYAQVIWRTAFEKPRG